MQTLSINKLLIVLVRPQQTSLQKDLEMTFHSLLLILFCFSEIHAFYSTEELCTLSMSQGKCVGAVEGERWFFNSGVCEMFQYSGCGGNANSFETEQECLGTCGEICKQPAVEGSCEQNYTRYYFNESSQECETFVYSGCGGNENNFADFASCRKVCKNECTLDPESGLCRALIQRFFYNSETGNCESFVYGGCGGNNNNFESIQECEERCQTFENYITTTDNLISTEDTTLV